MYCLGFPPTNFQLVPTCKDIFMMPINFLKKKTVNEINVISLKQANMLIIFWVKSWTVLDNCNQSQQMTKLILVIL
jgi:hypothetical protein